MDIHAIVVVTIGLVTSRLLLSSIYCYIVGYLLLIAKIKMNCKLAFKSITLLQMKICFMLKVSPEPSPLK